MALSKERHFLFEAVKRWFNDTGQVSHYSDEFHDGPTAAERHLLHTLPGGGSVLDVGCGTGRISVYLAERGYQVTGIDVSEALLSVARDFARKRSLDIHFLQTEGITLPFPDNSFDILIGFKILCYIPTRALRHEYLTEFYRVLKPGGTCVITQNIVPDEYLDDAQDEHFRSSPAAQFGILEKGDTFPMGRGYVHWFTEGDLLSEIKNTNFVLELFDTDENHGGAGYLRLIRLRKIGKTHGK